MCYSVYILYSYSIDIFYKGQTNNLADRIKRHNLMQEKATRDGAPWILIWSTCKQFRTDAVVLEQLLPFISRL